MEDEHKQIKIIVAGFLILSLLAFALVYSDGKLTGNVSEVQCLVYLQQLENQGRFNVKPQFGEEYWFEQNCLKYLEKKERQIITGTVKGYNPHEEAESMQVIKDGYYNKPRGPSSCIANTYINQPQGAYNYEERQTKDPYSRIISAESIKNDLHSIRCSLFSGIPAVTSSYEENTQKSTDYEISQKEFKNNLE